jgi:hypothetical protein
MDEKINWHDPETRLALIERVGTEEYSRLMLEYKKANPIQVVPSRYGVVYWVTEAQVGFSTREEAEKCLACRRNRKRKGSPDGKAKPGFYHFAESWYYERCRKGMKPDAPLDDVTFGLYHADGSTAAEMAMEWRRLGDLTTLEACLRVWDDAFELLRDFADVWRELAAAQPSGECKTRTIRPKEFCELLGRCSFEDLTQRTGPLD